MEESKEQKIAQHKLFIETKARIYLKPLMIDILKEKPEDVLDFMIYWCSKKGKDIRDELKKTHDIQNPQKISTEKQLNPDKSELPKQEEVIKDNSEDNHLQIDVNQSHNDESHQVFEEAIKQVGSNSKLSNDNDDKKINSKLEINNQNKSVNEFEVKQLSHNKLINENEVKQPSHNKLVSDDHTNQIQNHSGDNVEKDKQTDKEKAGDCNEVKPKDEYNLPSSEEELNDNEEDDTKVQEKLNTNKVNKKKMGISAEAYGNYNQMKEFVAPVIEKTPEQIEQIKKTLGMSFMFKNLEAKDFETVIGAMTVKNYNHNDYVITQGDDGAELFIVGEGTLKCVKLFEGKDEPTFLKNYQIGEVFGELSLMYNAPRAASIISEQNSVCFSLDRDTFNNIVKGASMKKRTLFDEFLKKVEILSDLEEYERSKICDCLVSETFVKGDFIIREGEEGNKFYFIQEGSAEAVMNQDGEEVKVFEYSVNDYFGELALLNNDKRKASIRVTSDSSVVVSLDKNSFKRLLGPIESILQRNVEKYSKFSNQIVS